MKKVYFFDVDGCLDLGDSNVYEGQKQASISMKLLRELKKNNEVFIANEKYWCQGLYEFIPPIKLNGINLDNVNVFDFRKRIIEETIRILKLDKKDCFYIGDLPKDKACAESIGINFVWAGEFEKWLKLGEIHG